MPTEKKVKTITEEREEMGTLGAHRKGAPLVQAAGLQRKEEGPKSHRRLTGRRPDV